LRSGKKPTVSNFVKIAACFVKRKKEKLAAFERRKEMPFHFEKGY
jgi:hypothetical protein